MMLYDFEAAEVSTGETTIFLRRSGSGPVILLLHGFPQTHVMWRGVAPACAIPLACTPSKSTGPQRPATASMTTRTAGAGCASPARCWRSGVAGEP